MIVESEFSCNGIGRSEGVVGGALDAAEVDECVRDASATVEKSLIVRVGTRVCSSGFVDISTNPPEKLFQQCMAFIYYYNLTLLHDTVQGRT